MTMKFLTKLFASSTKKLERGELLPQYNVKCTRCKESVTVRFSAYYPSDYSALPTQEKTEVSLVCNNVYCDKHQGEVHFLNFGLGNEQPTFPIWCIDNTKYPVELPIKPKSLLNGLQDVWYQIFGRPGFRKGDLLPQYSLWCYYCKEAISVRFYNQQDPYDNKMDVTLVCNPVCCKRRKDKIYTLDFGQGDDYPTFP
jgi:hypothetical protein